MPIDGFRDSGPQIDEKELDALERQLEIELPSEYREFLLRTNGGIPHPQEAFAVMGDKDAGSVLGFFYSVSHETQICTIAQNRLAFRKRIPSDLLAIAGDVFDNQICIGVGHKNRGKIFFWSMEDEAGPDKKPWRRNIRQVAKSLAEFLQSFHLLEEDT